MKTKIFVGLIGIIVLLTAQMSRAESMKVGLVSIGAVTHGTMNSDTNYSSVLHNGSLLQNRYEFEADEVGGKCAVIQTLELAPSSDIYGASLNIQMDPLADSIVYLATEEKIGTGILRTRAENQVEKFSGAAGSGLGVTETSHDSESWTDNGEAGHIVVSEGQGLYKAGMVGHYLLYQGPDPDPDEEGGLHPQLCPWAHGVELVELANQNFEYHYRQRGEYEHAFTGVIGPPPAY